MEYNLPQNEQKELLPIKNANLPVVVVIRKLISVKCPVSNNIAKDSIAERTPVKSKAIPKDFLQQTPHKKKYSCQRFFVRYQRYQSVLSVFIDGVYKLKKLKIADKKCKIPKPQKRVKKSIENIDKVNDIFSL